LAAHLLPAMMRSKERSARTVCLNNIKRITGAMLISAEENEGSFPGTRQATYLYSEFIHPNLIAKNTASAQETEVYECPFNPMIWILPTESGSRTISNSYLFNGQNASFEVPGIAGEKTFRIENPKKTTVIFEGSALHAYDGHSRKDTPRNNAENLIGFLDGHVDLTKIYWNGQAGEAGEPWNYDPPAGYKYKWSVK
jgi:hypothetical protein